MASAGYDGAIFIVEIGQRHGVNFFGGAPGSGPVLAIEGEASVFHQPGGKTQIARHAHGGFHRIVGDDARHHQRHMSGAAQLSFQVGADESAVGVLCNHGFTRQGRGLRPES